MAFGRVIEVYVGETSSSQKLKITDLKMEFEIKKGDFTSEKDNLAKISIYNVNEETATKLSEAGNFIDVKAGYKDEEVTSIFMGEIVRCERERSGSDIVVKVSAMDARSFLLESRLSISYAKNTSVSTIVKKIIDIIGLSVTGYEKVPSSEKYEHGYSYVGLAQDCLTEVLNRVGLGWEVQDEHLYILRPDENIKEVGYRLTPETGLLTIPTPVSDNTTSLPMGEVTPNAWKFKCILLPGLVPNAICKVESRTLNSNILIQKVKLKGTNYGDEFSAEIEGVEP